MEHRYPVVLGKDFAGTVEAAGDGVSGFGRGDPVFSVVMKPHLGDGSIAEYVTIPEQYGIEPCPDGLDPATAGALGLAGSAALAAIEAARTITGKSVLVSGATGGVGSLVVQYAARAGANVLATARPGADAGFVRDLGAHEVIDYAGDLTAQVRALASDGVAVVFHLAGDPEDLTSLLTPGGHIVSTLGYGAEQNGAAVAVMANPDTSTLGRLADDVLAGRLRMPIGHTFPLVEAVAAFRAFGAGTRGKVAISVP
jgi:NADPH:quinone reductase-like Zn-dependent oxidoreductase